jgi:DNA-binding winged helix-turn-helix (wHTH) protein
MRTKGKEAKVRDLPLSLRLDAVNAQVWQGARLLKLTPKAFAVLHYLQERPGQLVIKDELMRVVWADTVVSDGVLAASIRELRKELNDDPRAPQYLQTVHRRGYRFIGHGVSAQSSVVSTEEERQKAKIGVRDLGPGADSSPQTPSLKRQAPSIVGRESELSHLYSLFAKALQGERQLGFITGEAGIGKTTLINAFRQRLVSSPLAPSPKPLAPRMWMAVGQCIEYYGVGEAYLPVLEALGRLCRGPEGAQLITLLTKHAPTWLVQMPSLLAAGELEALLHKTQGVTRERMLRELAEALEVITAERPLILVLEDLHWSDLSTLDLLSMIARRTEPARLLIISTYRPVDVIVREHPLQTVKQELLLHGQCQELALELLSEAAILDYLSARFAVPAPLQREGKGEG